ncbi:hypothetical protein GXP67_28870 [Rhodocytophaga rosea]|uniref:Uncharacterized protein n=1 Tax=Rhodocytophaga rosea TaxID=2704465 RepID=A0A6C0GR81_9BACT|nr:hypothetical protein [Rhodocytophaga rosea]QHT70384.1 hypothetical protein GXP67_28870 [Rhodocytophaga rosea]
MKKTALLIVSILFLGAFTAMAQNPVVFKYKVDPGYSTNNYKHPNKAAVANKYNMENHFTGFSYIKPLPVLQVQQWNYKNQDFAPRTGVAFSGAVLPVPPMKHYKNPQQSPANYKHQFGK